MKAIPIGFQFAFERGTKALEAGDKEAARAAYRECARICPEAWLGVACETHKAGNHNEAIELYNQTIEFAMSPATKAVAYNNLAGLLQDLNLTDEAEWCYRMSWSIHKTADAANNLGLTAQHAHRIAEAMKWYEESIRLNPRMKQIYLNRALSSLLVGDYVAGFREYESRWDAGTVYKKLPVFRPEWKGEPLQGKRIMVYHEQGAGDIIMMARFFRDLRERGAEVLVSCHPGLAEFLKSGGCCDEIYEDLHLRIAAGNCPRWDYQIPIMSLARILGTTTYNCGRRAYLKPPGRQWAFSGEPNLKIAIAWAGYGYHGADYRRSTKLEEWLPLFKMDGINWYSIQVGPRSIDLAGGDYPVSNLATGIKDFADTADIISKMDLTICVDTSPCHVAGAIGAPTWLLCAYAPDWRWGLNGERSPWYDSVQIFRQDNPKDGWPPVIARIQEALRLKTSKLQSVFQE